ncbi:MAG: hypothetical protein U0939_22140 [Pirellulales bacterium]
MTIRLTKLIALLPADTEQRVEKTRTRADHRIRDVLRRETGLQLNRDLKQAASRTDPVSVPIDIKPGLPAELEDLEFDDEYWLSVTIAPYRRKLELAREGLTGSLELIPKLLASSDGKRLLAGRQQASSESIGLISELLAFVAARDPLTRILSINTDVLGCYRYSVAREQNLPLFGDAVLARDPFDGRIELYWGVIGLVATTLNADVEALTTVVLAHELAHAYTHMGADIDGERWATFAFSKTDKAVVEGLAQYYTHLVCERLEETIPGTMFAYLEMCPRQPPIYRTHLPWIKDYLPEIVRSALLETRRNRKLALQDFEDSLAAERKRLRKKDYRSSSDGESRK